MDAIKLHKKVEGKLSVLQIILLQLHEIIPNESVYIKKTEGKYV